MVEIDRFKKVRRLMYTQCPDCSTAFRVTADVLKQAAGKVRCGGCGHAFNALEFLSETLPKQSPKAEAEHEEALPELKPEPLISDGRVTKPISAKQSAALLKTLDDLAGPDIRIEDTGVEWRVLDEDELGEAAGDPVASPKNVAPPDASVTEVHEFPEESPTQVDELRFDDHTPIPDGFNSQDDLTGAAYSAYPLEDSAAELTETDVVSDDVDEAVTVDLDLSDPNEWTEILDEFEGLAEVVAAEPDIEAETELDDVQDIDQEDAPGDTDKADAEEQPLDVDTQFALQAEAMGIDLSGMHKVVDEPEPEDALEVDELLHDGGDDDRELEGLIKEKLVDEIGDEEQDDATQLDLIGEDVEDAAEITRDEDVPDETLEELESEDDLDALDELEDDLEETDDDLDEELDEVEVELDLLHELDDELDDALSGAETEPDQVPEDLEPEDEESEDQESEDEGPGDEEPEEQEPGDEEHVEQEPEDEEPVDEEPVGETEDSSEHDETYVPPMTEEEQTINMQIDQDLMALAMEDDEGLTATMVFPDDAAEGQADDRKDFKTEDEQALMDTSAGFETIIMEGEFVRSALDQEKLAADAAAAADALARAAAAQREAEKAEQAGKRHWGIIAGIVALILLFSVQVLHQSREKLATIPAFNNVVGPMYRAIGKPLSPDWDVTGWRFEATKGSTDQSDENLSIYSRIGNKSDKPLPYPLVAISLTDRFEETVGSRILDPADYLSADLDPRKLVQPGNTFNAVITVQSPAATVTGFKLNVCYRESGGQLRCAIDDFK